MELITLYGNRRVSMAAQRYNFSSSIDVRVASAKLKARTRNLRFSSYLVCRFLQEVRDSPRPADASFLHDDSERVRVLPTDAPHRPGQIPRSPSPVHRQLETGWHVQELLSQFM
ncbi:unnamed protein product, partial [Bemisia tabaci]